MCGAPLAPPSPACCTSAYCTIAAGWLPQCAARLKPPAQPRSPPRSDLEARLLELLNMKGRQRHKWEALTSMLANNIVYDDKRVRRNAPTALDQLVGCSTANAIASRLTPPPVGANSRGLGALHPPGATLPVPPQPRLYLQPEPQPGGMPRLGLLYAVRQAEVPFDQPAALVVLDASGAPRTLPFEPRSAGAAAAAVLARMAASSWRMQAHDGWQLLESEPVSRGLAAGASHLVAHASLPASSLLIQACLEPGLRARLGGHCAFSTDCTYRARSLCRRPPHRWRCQWQRGPLSSLPVPAFPEARPAPVAVQQSAAARSARPCAPHEASRTAAAAAACRPTLRCPLGQQGHAEGPCP